MVRYDVGEVSIPGGLEHNEDKTYAHDFTLESNTVCEALLIVADGGGPDGGRGVTDSGEP